MGEVANRGRDDDGVLEATGGCVGGRGRGRGALLGSLLLHGGEGLGLQGLEGLRDGRSDR